MSPEEQLKMLDRHLAELGEHFDAVEILATDTDGEGTSTLIRGIGNYWARIGLAHEFINRQERDDSAVKIAEEIRKED